MALTTTASDVEQWRADTPGCSHVTHFNNAGSSLPTLRSLRAAIDHLELEARIGGYEAAGVAADKIEHAYQSVAVLLGAQRSEIALIENATRAWDMAFYSIPFATGDRIVTGISEYASNYLAFMQIRNSRGVEIVVCPDDEHGQLDIEELERLCATPPRLIAITHAPTNGGVVNPAHDVGRIARACGALYLLDACQSVGQLPVDVDAIGCDFLSVTGRKFLRGPRGTGFLYARATTTHQLHPPFVDLHAGLWDASDSYALAPGAARFENWESNVAARIALGVAVDDAIGIGLDVIEARNRELSTYLRGRLSELDGVAVHDKGAQQSAIVTCAHESIGATTLRDELRAQAVNTSVTVATSTRLDFEARRLPDMLRLSVHYFNTIDEIDHVVDTMRGLIAKR
jgi:cysteine desulfurase / selenocysteine lyase